MEGEEPNPPCECEHPQSQHKLRRGGCRALDCDCARFRVPKDRPAPVDPPAVPDGEAVAILRKNEEIRAGVIRELNDDLKSVRAELEATKRQLLAARAEAAKTTCDVPRAAPAADVLWSYPAWQCLAGPNPCGRRYTRAEQAENHACGPMAAVTVTVTTRGAAPS